MVLPSDMCNIFTTNLLKHFFLNWENLLFRKLKKMLKKGFYAVKVTNFNQNVSVE